MTEEIGPTTPLRLKQALKIAFPAGGMTLSGLRGQMQQGNLTYEMISNKVFVTLQGIEEMRERCRVHAKVQGSGSGPSANSGTEQSQSPSGSSETGPTSSPQDALRMKLQQRRGNSKSTSPRNTPRLVKSGT